MGRDADIEIDSLRAKLFQSTRPHGARREMVEVRVSRDLFQSTRPHGARHHLFMAVEWIRGVSIHAPAWGATAVVENCD